MNQIKYTPENWYWLKQNKQVYGSARMLEVQAADASYQSWLAEGNQPTPYPKDENGNESEAELAAVLAAFGLFVGSAEKNKAEIAAARVRRDELLASCDWTQMADAPLTKEQKTAWQTYRQALRDVTTQPGFPQELSWPEFVVTEGVSTKADKPKAVRASRKRQQTSATA